MAGKAITMRSRAEEEADAQMKGAGGRRPKCCPTPFSQSGAVWPYQPFRQTLNARPDFLTRWRRKETPSGVRIAE